MRLLHQLQNCCGTFIVLNRKTGCMQRYISKSGKSSGVTGYEIGKDYIVVQFGYSDDYTYTYKSAGKSVIETMKRLALSNEGLSTFISKEDPSYESKRKVHQDQ